MCDGFAALRARDVGALHVAGDPRRDVSAERRPTAVAVRPWPEPDRLGRTRGFLDREKGW